MHDRLREELRDLGLDGATPPCHEKWAVLLERVSAICEEAEGWKTLNASVLALRQSEARNRALVEAIPDIIFRLRPDGTFLDFKPWETSPPLMGGETIRGRSLWDLQAEHPNALPRSVAERGMRLVRRALATGQAQTVEYSIETDDGPRSFETRLVPLDEQEVIGLVRDVTERVQGEAALRRSEEKTRALLDAIPDLMFLLSSDLRFLEWKPAKGFEPHVPPERFLGRQVEEVLAQELAQELRRLTRDLRSGEVYTLEYEVEGSEFEARVTACGTGMLAMVRDVTERKRSDSELRHREALYTNLFRHSTDGIVLHDVEGRILNVNQRAESLFGYRKDEIVGRMLDDLHPTAGRSEARYEARRMGRDGVVEFETRYRRKDGETFIAEVSASAFETGGQRVVQSILRDVTERRVFEESLKAAKEEAERANRAKSQFLSNMSHELRTPLNAILGFGRVLDRGAYGTLNERQRQYLRDIIQSGEHMLELVNNLLDLRRLEERRDLIRAVATDVRPVVDDAVSMVRPLVAEKGHQLVAELPPELPSALADDRALLRVLVNLLSNAVKYTQPGGTVRLRAAQNDNHLVFEIHDSGVGIAPESQARIFNYFEQVKGAEQLGVTGSGIGLALSRELVERMGGAIGVRSEPGRGSVFYFTLPLAPNQSRRAEGKKRPTSANRGPS